VGILTTMTKKILGLIITLFLTSCYQVDFDSYFPTDQRPLEKFDYEYIGKYYYADSVFGKEDFKYTNSKYSHSIEESDSTALFSIDITIFEKYATLSIEFVNYYKIDKVDTSRIRKKHRNKGMTVEYKYIIHKEIQGDTILNISTKDKLFLYNGKYYMNIYVDPEKGKADTSNAISLGPSEKHWIICQVEKRNGSEFSFNMTNKADYVMLFDTTKNWQPIFPVAHLTNKQFKKFVSKGGFHQKYKFIKYAH